MSVALAFLHHLAAFVLVAVLAVELVLLKGELTPSAARRLRGFDAVYGAAAGVLLVAGLLRVFYFEKGAAYYFQSAPFIAKLALFIAVGLLSVYPTLTFWKWVRSGTAVAAASQRTVRTLVHVQLAGVVLILLCAAMMARGVGFFG